MDYSVNHGTTIEGGDDDDDETPECVQLDAEESKVLPLCPAAVAALVVHRTVHVAHRTVHVAQLKLDLPSSGAPPISLVFGVVGLACLVVGAPMLVVLHLVHAERSRAHRD